MPAQNLNFDEVFTYQGEWRLIALRCVEPTKYKGPYFQLGPLPNVSIIDFEQVNAGWNWPDFVPVENHNKNAEAIA